MIDILLATIATFGVSALISDYDGPYSLLSKLRSLSKVFACTVCVSVWVAIPITIFTGIGFLGYLCVIGGIVVIERLT